MFIYKFHVWMEGLLVPESQDQLCPWLSPNSTLPREVDAKKKADPGLIGRRPAKAAARAGVPEQKECAGDAVHTQH